MEGGKPLVLADNASLVQKDLSRVYAHMKSKSNLENVVAVDARFKKKELVSGLAKSVLKHRITNLTGVNFNVIERELGVELSAVTDVQKLAKLLILEASDRLESLPQPSNGSSSRKRLPDDDEHEDEPRQKRSRNSVKGEDVTAMVTATRKRSSRRSSVCASPAKPSNETSAYRRSPTKTRAIETVEEEKPDEEIDSTRDEGDEALPDVGDNPTPQMLALRRKSMAKLAKASPAKAAKSSPAKVVSPAKPKVAKKPPAPAKTGFSGDEDSAVYLVETDFALNGIKYGDIARNLCADGEDFPGANLAVIHTPSEWNANDVFRTVASLKALNSKAKLDDFVLLVGCGVANVNMFREALYVHTKHVQLVVFEREDKNANEDGNDFFLRDTLSMFLIAYFFPDCGNPDKKPSARMVRANTTTCFHTTSIEDLENVIVHAMSEKGDWIFDLGCNGRELGLAAQKSGRNAVVLEPNHQKLVSLKTKATAIAQHFDESFRSGIDGKIIKF